MAALLNKPLLRGTLKKLRSLPLDTSNHPNVMMVAQEMLDFLAMRAGIKPVYLLGRGFDDRKWIEGAVAIAQQANLHVIEGPAWNAGLEDEALPAWFRDHVKATEQTHDLFYICRTNSIADSVQNSLKNLTLTIDEEARLLGYPPCCVRSHYDRVSLMDRTFYKMVKRVAKGDVAEMQRILQEDTKVTAETPEEKAAVEEATKFVPAKFTSFYMCAACAQNPLGPANTLSKKYQELAQAIDESLMIEIGKTSRSGHK